MLSVLDLTGNTGAKDEREGEACMEIDLQSESDGMSDDVQIENGPPSNVSKQDTSEVTKALLDIKAEEKPALAPAAISNWLKNSPVLKNYYVYSHASIRLKCRVGLRGHPVTVKLLASFFDWLFSQQFPATSLLVSSEHHGLIAALLEESSSVDPTSEIQDVLLPYCAPQLNSVQLQFVLNEVAMELQEFIHAIGKPAFHGLPQAKSARDRSSCMLWRVEDQFIPAPLASTVSVRRLAREMAAHQLKIEYEQLLGPKAESEKVLPEVKPVEEPVVVATPVKRGRGRSSKDTPAANSKHSSGQAQLHSFFTVTRKTPANETSAEYFQPFQLGANSTMSPINHFADYMMMAEEESQLPASASYDDSSFWAEFRRHCKKSAVAWQGKPQASSIASEYVFFTAKLIQFHENFRPAFFGSLRKHPTGLSGRRPFGKAPSLDYEVDSDDDWCEEEEAGADAESILTEDEDEEEEEEEDDEEGEDDVSGDDWLVAEEADMPTFKRQSYKKGQKKRYIQLQPAMHLNIHAQPIPEMLKGMRVRPLGSFTFPLDPFAGCAPIMVPRVKSAEPSVVKIAFKEETHLPALALLAHGSPLGVGKLYEQFAAAHGHVSKKAFELRLNQIAEKIRPTTSPLAKMCWKVRPEYEKLLTVPATESNEMNLDDPSAMLLVEQVADVIMQE